MCVCTEMLWMCVLYVRFGSKVKPRTFRYVAMGSALLCILGPDILFCRVWSEQIASCCVNLV